MYVPKVSAEDAALVCALDELPAAGVSDEEVYEPLAALDALVPAVADIAPLPQSDDPEADITPPATPEAEPAMPWSGPERPAAAPESGTVLETAARQRW